VKICVTGGSGFIGRYCCQRLHEDGHEVVIFDLVTPEWDASAMSYSCGDVRDPGAVTKALAGCDRVLHLAAAHHDFGIDHQTYYDVNEGGASVLCDAMDECGITSLCFYSTVAVYGTAAAPLSEATTPEPNTPYGGSKLAGERVFKQWTERGGDRTSLVIRPTVTFGPRNFANMYTLIDQIDRGRFLMVGRGDNIKSLSYVENIVDATMHLWLQDRDSAFEVFNYIDKPDLTSRQISLAVYEALGKRPPRISWPMWMVRCGAIPFDIIIALTGKNLPISSARVKKMFQTQTCFEAQRIADAGYTYKIELTAGISRMVAWYQEHGKGQDATWHQPPADVVES
jgi:nucleoside-diphosphate-sugar epimerase